MFFGILFAAQVQLVHKNPWQTLTCEAHEKLEEFDSAHGEAVVGLLKSSLPPGEAKPISSS